MQAMPEIWHTISLPLHLIFLYTMRQQHPYTHDCQIYFTKSQTKHCIALHCIAFGVFLESFKLGLGGKKNGEMGLIANTCETTTGCGHEPDHEIKDLKYMVSDDELKEKG